MDIHQVLREYRNGDEDIRVKLFLAYRDLRNDFIEIEGNPDGERVSEA